MTEATGFINLFNAAIQGAANGVSFVTFVMVLILFRNRRR